MERTERQLLRILLDSTEDQNHATPYNRIESSASILRHRHWLPRTKLTHALKQLLDLDPLETGLGIPFDYRLEDPLT